MFGPPEKLPEWHTKLPHPAFWAEYWRAIFPFDSEQRVHSDQSQYWKALVRGPKYNWPPHGLRSRHIRQNTFQSDEKREVPNELPKGKKSRQPNQRISQSIDSIEHGYPEDELLFEQRCETDDQIVIGSEQINIMRICFQYWSYQWKPEREQRKQGKQLLGGSKHHIEHPDPVPRGIGRATTRGSAPQIFNTVNKSDYGRFQ